MKVFKFKRNRIYDFTTEGEDSDHDVRKECITRSSYGRDITICKMDNGESTRVENLKEIAIGVPCFVISGWADEYHQWLLEKVAFLRISVFLIIKRSLDRGSEIIKVTER